MEKRMTVAADAIAAPPPPATDALPSRRQFLGRAAFWASVPVMAGAYATQVEPFWPRVYERPMPIRNLPGPFEGYRVAHLTDLHTGYANFDYLRGVVRRIADLKPDLVLVTGDLIHHRRAAAAPAAAMLREAYVSAGIPTVVSFGNHEFGYARRPNEPADDTLHLHAQEVLTDHGCIVLRNRSHTIERNGARLWLVGLDDLWFGQFDPALGFLNVPRDEPRIALSHNPDTVPFLAPFAPDLILSGHTHGGQIRLPFYGPPRLNIRNTQHDWGVFDLDHGGKLYVSSGVGYIQRVRFRCRPEAPVFRLTG